MLAPASRSLSSTASSESACAPRTATSPPVAATAARKVPVSIRSGMTACVAPCRRATPSTVMRSLPAPEMRAPIAVRQRARSTISGSRAAFSRIVVPSASVAAISRFSVPVTVTMSNTMVAPRRRPVRVDVAVLEVDGRAHRLEALDVLVDRPQSDRAAAGQRHARLAAAREQRPERQDRRAHRLDQLVRRERPVDPPRVERHDARRAARPAPRPSAPAAAPSCPRRSGAARW